MSDRVKKINPAALIALKEALSAIYWYKRDLRSFITYTIKNNTIVPTIDWENNVKYYAVSELVDRMAARPDLYYDDLLSLFRETVNFTDFSHLNRCEDPEQKIGTAQEKVEALRAHVRGHLDLLKEREQAAERRLVAQQKRARSTAFRNKLGELNDKFYKIAMSDNHQQRGYDLEQFLNELFILFDLDPKSSFKIAGEQIDGAFTFDNNDYLLEAKWQQKPVDAGDLYKFAGVLTGKLKNTLGLFISINGFSPECTSTKSEGLKAMILMDGADLNAILDVRIDLHEMLYRKRRYASQTGNIYLPVSVILR
ncbi:restriction endonuclease [bacterium]|nr:restriction endonuclease [bacterium]